MSVTDYGPRLLREFWGNKDCRLFFLIYLLNFGLLYQKGHLLTPEIKCHFLRYKKLVFHYSSFFTAPDIISQGPLSLLAIQRCLGQMEN